MGWWQAEPAGHGCGLDAGGAEREGSGPYIRVDDNAVLYPVYSEEDRVCRRRG